MNLEQFLEQFKLTNSDNITWWNKIPKKEARFDIIPPFIDKRIVEVLKFKKISKLYSHQALAIEKINNDENVVVVTPTASGKTLCYNIPILNRILEDSDTRALYLFPTKALSQDQTSELYSLVELLDEDIKTYTYDGDTPVSARKSIRQAGHIVVTNPDMLHSGILPHHTKWTKLFENIKYIVIDEIHHYRGVFGSHLSNVVRRLLRICNFYNSNPIFICCSATIANPRELTSKIVNRKVSLIDNNGAPSGEKNIIFLNPPLINKQLGIRKSNLLEAKNLTLNLIKNNVKTIIFTRSRLSVEVLVTYLKDLYFDNVNLSERVKGYRGGYLPNLRREIESGLRNGEITGVVSTNALELGIDIGNLDACIICGYPGSIASTWQQAGRAGRRNSVSAIFVIAGSSPLDQYIIKNPDYFINKSPENGLINPDNLSILYNHMKCAAFELPFEKGENFGVETTNEILKFMGDAKIVRNVKDRWYWMSDVFPASEVSLRSASNENFIIIDITSAKHKVIGEIDRFSAPMLIHEEAIYIHEGQQYQVEELDFENKKAYIRKVNVDYYTDANLAVDLRVIDVFSEEESEKIIRYKGEVVISAIVNMFKKIKLYTHENIGSGPVELPELELHTTAYWISLPENIKSIYSKSVLQNGLIGLSNSVANTTPVFLMCDPKDINVVYNVKAPFTQKPTIYVYDSYPGGVGFSEKFFSIDKDIFITSKNMIENCKCEKGCPSCIGALNEFSDLDNCKNITIDLLNLIINSFK